MTRRIEWLPAATDGLLTIPSVSAAEQVASAVRRYAEEGIGFVLHVAKLDGPDEFRLLIPRMRTYLIIRPSSTTLYVERVIYRP